jgi:hypothetical protein
MKTITLKEAYQILEDANAVIIDNDVVLYPSLSELEDDETNEFLYFQWEDEGQGYNLKFNEGDNQEVKVVGSSMFLYDTDSEGEDYHTQITILIPKELEDEIDVAKLFKGKRNEN